MIFPPEGPVLYTRNRRLPGEPTSQGVLMQVTIQRHRSEIRIRAQWYHDDSDHVRVYYFTPRSIDGMRPLP